MMARRPKYPNIRVALTREDESDVFATLAQVCNVMRNAGVAKAKVREFWCQAVAHIDIDKEPSADEYDHAMQVTLRWVGAIVRRI
jgi:hypothetical protein